MFTLSAIIRPYCDDNTYCKEGKSWHTAITNQLE